MSVRRKHRGDGPGAGRLTALLALSGCFALGLIAGCVVVSHLGQGAVEHLSAYLDGYFSLLVEEGAAQPSLISTFWEVFRWPLAAAVFGLTAFGAVAVPFLFCVRGFLLSFAVSVFLQLFGFEGLFLSAAVFGISALLSVTGLFIIGLDAFALGRSLTGGAGYEAKERDTLKRRLLLHGAAALCWLTAGALAQHWFSPLLLKAAVSLLR